MQMKKELRYADEGVKVKYADTGIRVRIIMEMNRR